MVHLASLFLVLPLVQERPAAVDQVAVRIDRPAALELLLREASDIDDHLRLRDGRVVVYADDAEQARLASLGFELEVLQEDLASFYAQRAAADAALGPGPGSMGGFRTLAEIGQAMDALAASYPSIVSPKFSIGTSVEGRPIWAMRVSDNPSFDERQEPVAWYDALHHAREPMSGESLLLFAEYLCQNYPADPDVARIVRSRSSIFIPCVNPDGYEYNHQTNPNGGGGWRKNRRNNGDGSFGIDLNRNWGWEWGPQWSGSSGTTSNDLYRGPSAFSEPETRALRDFMALHPPGMAISAHTHSNLWLYAWGYDEVYTPDDARFSFYGAAMTATNGWPFGTVWEILYLANGVSADWQYGQHGTFSFSPEIGSQTDGFWPPPSRIQPLFQSVLPGYLLVAKWTGGWADFEGITTVEALGDGDAAIEPGETWRVRLDVENRGVLAVEGVAHLASQSPHVTVEIADAPFFAAPGSTAPLQIASSTRLAPHTAKDPRPYELLVAVSPNAPTGIYDLDLDLTYEGATTHEVISIDVGVPRELAHDDMESAIPGWQVVNATSGSWERAVPQQTISAGLIAQPGTDNPAGTGTRCRVTGAAAGSFATQFDVDGTTVLTSPRFSAAGFGHLELSYARWFANLPGTGIDDVLLVEASNNGGGSWTMLESKPNANAWHTVSFDLEDHLALTSNMVVRFTAADQPDNDLTEACIDDVVLRTLSTLPTLGIFGATSQSSVPRLFVDGPQQVSYRIQSATQIGSGTSVPGTQGLLYLQGTLQTVAFGTTDAAGRARFDWTVPAGTTIYLQALLDEGGSQAAYSSLVTVVVQ